MTALKSFAVAANGTPMGVYQGTDADAAVLAYALDAGFKSIEDAATRYLDREVCSDDVGQIIADWCAELDVEEVPSHDAAINDLHLAFRIYKPGSSGFSNYVYDNCKFGISKDEIAALSRGFEEFCDAGEAVEFFLHNLEHTDFWRKAA
jgi:hypothetical protein